MKDAFNDGLLWILQRLAGETTPHAGEGIESQIQHSWFVPPWITLLLLLGSAVWIGLLYWRERGGGWWVRLSLATLRFLLVALVVLMMYGWMKHRYRTDLPDLVILIDDTASMKLADTFADPALRARLLAQVQKAGLDEVTRINLTKALLVQDQGQLLRQLRQSYNVHLYLVGESARRLVETDRALLERLSELPAEQQASRLGNGLQDVLQQLRGRPTAAAILLTDGVTTEGRSLSEAADYARRKRIPLFVVGIGSAQAPRDIRLSDLLVDDIVFVGDLVNFDLKLTASGFSNQDVQVRLRAGQGPVLAEQTVKIESEGQPQAIRLAYRPPEQGDFRYTVEAVPLDNEADRDNNAQSRLVSVRDETIRVLYVQEYPSFDYKFLKSLLGRGLKRTSQGEERSIELTTVLQEADLESAQQDQFAQRIFPVSREELFQYDVLLFGDVNPAFLSRSVMENIAEFVKTRGGGLVFIAGPRHTPLAYRDSPLSSLFPISLTSASMPPPQAELQTPFPVQVTPLGLSSPHLQLADRPAETIKVWNDLPGLFWLLEAPDVRPGARVVLEHPGRTGNSGQNLPVACVQFVGAGKVVFLATDETYRWSRHPAGEQFYSRFWIQTIRYLSRAKLLGTGRAAEMTVDRQQYRRGESVRLRVRFFDDRQAPPADDGVTIMLERSGAARRQITLRRDAGSRGVFEGTVSNLPEGAYRGWMATPTLEGQPPSQRFAIVAPLGEQARLTMDIAELQQAAKQSQGRYYGVENMAGWINELPAGRQVRIEPLPPSPIWNSSLLAGLFASLLVAEWLLRKRMGML